MLRWMCGVREKDRISNEKIKGTTKVVEMSKKAQERQLQWYGHESRKKLEEWQVQETLDGMHSDGHEEKEYKKGNTSTQRRMEMAG